MLRNGDGNTVVFYRIMPEVENSSLETKITEKLKEEDVLFSSGLFKNYHLSPFEDIHYGVNSSMQFPFVGIIDKDFINLFIAAGVLLLIFALLNYISLSVAQTGFRAREMATRRLLGEQKAGIVSRYLLEAFILTLTAFCIAIPIVDLCTPMMSSLLGKEVDVFGAMNIYSLASMLALVLLTSVCAGIIPAMIISGYRPVEIVKGSASLSGRMILGRIFIFIQNFVAIATICIAFAMSLQVGYMTNKEKGYNRSNIVAVTGVGNADDFFSDEIRSMPFVENIGYVLFDPVSQNRSSMGFSKDGEKVNIERLAGDMEAFRILGLVPKSITGEPVAGNYWLTESAVRNLGQDHNVTIVNFDGGYNIPVCGVIADLVTADRSEEECRSSNICYKIMEQKSKEDFTYLREMLVLVAGDEEKAAQEIRKFYEKKGFGPTDVQIHTLNYMYARYFTKENSNNRLITIFTILALMLSAMAMVAMSTYYTRQHSKNIAIKKIFGMKREAAFTWIVMTFLKVVIISAVAGIPVAYCIVEKWLQGYNDRISNAWWIYLAGVSVVLTVCMIAISRQAVRLMNVNPAETLRKE